MAIEFDTTLTKRIGSGTITATSTLSGNGTIQGPEIHQGSGQIAGNLILQGTPTNPVTASLFNQTVTITSQNSGSNIPYTFGMVVLKDAVNSSQFITVTGANSYQVDVKNIHAGGSVAFVIVSIEADFVAGVPINLTLGTTNTSPPGAPLNKANLLATAYDFEASVVHLGTTYILSARDLLDGTITPISEYQHLSGPLVSEWIVGGFVRNGVTPHPRLMAFFHVRYYVTGDVRTDFRLENTTTFQTKQALNLDVTLNQAGAPVYTNATATLHSHGYFKQTFWWPNNVDIYAQQDHNYFQQVLGVKWKNITPDNATLNALTQTIDTLNGEFGDLRNDWRSGGSAPQLALFPQWDAFWFISGDERARDSTLANSDALGSYSISYRDENSGQLPRLDDYSPTLALTQPEGGIPDDGSTSPLVPDRAHQPLIGFTSYLLTGDYAQWENCAFMANYNLLFATSSKKNGNAGEFLRDVDYELRGWAWGLRTLGACAWSCPDDHPLKTYFTSRTDNNIAYAKSEWSDNEAASGYKLGLVYNGSGAEFDSYPFWMHCFLNGCFGLLSDLGYNAAIGVRQYLSKWYRGTWDNDADFCYQVAADNRAPVGPSTTVAYQTFAEVYAGYNLSSACGSAAMTAEINAEIGGGFDPLNGDGQVRYSQLNDSYWANQSLGLYYAAKSGMLTGRAGFRHALAINQPSDFDTSPQWAFDVEAPIAFRAVNPFFDITEKTAISVDAITNLKAWDSQHDLTTYSSACYNPQRGAFQVSGGGHGDGQSVNVGVLNLNAATPIWDYDYPEPEAIYTQSGNSYFDRTDWAQIFDPINYNGMIFWPKPSDSGKTFQEAADLKQWYPVSLHTYDCVDFIGYDPYGKVINEMIIAGASGFRPVSETIPNARYEKHPAFYPTYDHVTQTWTWRGETNAFLSLRGYAAKWAPYDGYYYAFVTQNTSDKGIWRWDISDASGWEQWTFGVDYTGVALDDDSIEITAAYVHRPAENPFIVVRVDNFGSGTVFQKLDLVTRVMSNLPDGGVAPSGSEVGMFYDHVTDKIWACESIGGTIPIVYSYDFGSGSWSSEGQLTYTAPSNHGMHGSWDLDPINRVAGNLYQNDSSCYKLPGTPAADTFDGITTQWAPYIEWTINNVTSWSGNAFDVVSTVTFDHTTSSAQHITEMFYAGGNSWKCRFTGTETGIWTASSVSAISELNGLTGTITINANPDPDAKGFWGNIGNQYARQFGGVLRPQTFDVYLDETDYLWLNGFAANSIVSYQNQAHIDAYLSKAQTNGMDVVHAHVVNSWFSLGANTYNDHSSVSPDLATFDILDNVINTAYAQGMTLHIWPWGDETRQWTQVGLAGGINGSTDVRLQRYIAARLGALPNWTMNYGFDLQEWVNSAQITVWADNMHNFEGWPHLYMARGIPSASLDVVAYSGGLSGEFDYDDAVLNLDSDLTRPHQFEERFQYLRDPAYSMDGTRRLMWQFAMAGGHGSFWGREFNGPNYPNPEMLATHKEFWLSSNRLQGDYIRDNSKTDVNGLVLRDPGFNQWIFYSEDRLTITLNIGLANTPLPAVAVDTKIAYAEIDLGLLTNANQIWTAPYSSEWAIAIGTFL